MGYIGGRRAGIKRATGDCHSLHFELKACDYHLENKGLTPRPWAPMEIFHCLLLWV